MSSFTRQQLEDWLKTIEVKGGRVLDIGGSQNPLSKSRLKIFEPDEYKILDLEQPHECKVKPDYAFDLNKKFDRWKEEEIHYCDSFDIAFCLEVSEYWYNPYQALENINNLLKKDGELYISFHFIYPVHNPIKDDSIRLTPRGVEKLLQEAGFEIVEMKPRLMRYSGLWRDFYMSEEMRPAKEYDKYDWAGCLIKCKKI